MTERAIDKHIEWLEMQVKTCTQENGAAFFRLALANIRALALEEAKEKPTREELLIILSAWESVFGTSQLSHASARLQAAEDKVKRLEFQIAHTEKPTAPASLVEDIKAFAHKLVNVNGQLGEAVELEQILSRYRPSTQADIVGELRKHQEYLRECNCDCCTENIGVIEEIIRKHQGEAK